VKKIKLRKFLWQADIYKNFISGIKQDKKTSLTGWNLLNILLNKFINILTLKQE
jgi:hypothetical protein